MKTEAHIQEYSKFELLYNDKLHTPKSKKLKLDFQVSSQLACSITQSPKNPNNSKKHKDW